MINDTFLSQRLGLSFFEIFIDCMLLRRRLRWHFKDIWLGNLGSFKPNRHGYIFRVHLFFHFLESNAFIYTVWITHYFMEEF